MPQPPSPALVALAQACGVATEYADWKGRLAAVSQESIRAVLTAMGVDPENPEAALAEHELAPWRRMLPPCLVLVEDRGANVPVHIPHGDQVTLELVLEDGETRGVGQLERWVDPREVDGRLIGEATFALPAGLPLGYHTLRATSTPSSGQAAGREGPVSAEITAEITVVVTPRWLGLPPRAAVGRSWGLMTQLYSVRSRGSWGLGDLTDLTDLAVWSASEHQADYILINPLHAAEPLAPLEPSPYLPSTRRFVNPIYLRVEGIAEHAGLAPADRERVAALGAGLAPWSGPDDRVDRDAAWTAKRAALELLHRVPRSAARDRDFRAYCDREGESLRQFATWSAIAEEHGNDARSWPESLRDVGSAAVAAYARDHAAQVDLHRWLQWLVDEQLQQAQATAVGAGMRLGIVHDLAVGVHPGGADAWRLPDVYATGVQVGAPPDPYNQKGQDWTQPPWRPDRLAEVAYAPFRDLIGAVLRHAGGVRVDHILGLFRLWWIPVGESADHGTYVYYDHEAMVGVLALEAHRAGAVVVGEDLGVVAPETRSYLAGRGILGTSVLWFEYADGGGPLPADQWREWCLASVTTHDLPPTAGYLVGDQVRLQHDLGLLEGDLDDELASARTEIDGWLAELRRVGLLPDEASGADLGARVPGAPEVPGIVAALHRYLGLSPARMLNLALTDAVGDRRTQNQPGTDDQYPNWRIPLAGPDGVPLGLEEVFASAPANEVAAALGRLAGPAAPVAGEPG